MNVDVFTWAILNVNCCQEGVRGREQPLANCDAERKTERRLRVRAGEAFATLAIYLCIHTHKGDFDLNIPLIRC